METLGTYETVVPDRIPLAARIELMILHICSLLKDSMGKMSAFCTTRLWKQRSRDTAEKDGSVKSSTPEKLGTESVDSFVSKTTQAVQEILRKEVSEITEPLLDDVADHEYALLASDMSLRTDNVSGVIAESIVEEAKIRDSMEAELRAASQESHSPSSSQQPSPSPDLKKTGGSPQLREEEFNKCLRNKVKTFFASCFTKLSINRIRTQLKNKFCPNSKVQNSESLQSFIDSIDTLFKTENGDELGGNERGVFSRLRSISEGHESIFTQQLGDIIYSHLSEELSTQSDSKKSLPPPETLYEAISRKVWRLLGMMCWWVKMTSEIHSKRVVSALVAIGALSPSPTVSLSENTPQTPSVTWSEEALLKGTESDSISPFFVMQSKTSPAPKVTVPEKSLSPTPRVIVLRKSVTSRKSVSPTPLVTVTEGTVLTTPAVRVSQDRVSLTSDAATTSAVRSSQDWVSLTSDAAIVQTVKYKKVSLLVIKVVSRIYNEAKITRPADNPEHIIERLIEKTWADVGGEDFEITPETFKTLDKIVFKNLCRKWGSTDDVLVSMELEEAAFEDYVACSIKYLLLTPPKSKSSKFVSFFCKPFKAFTGLFKRS
ncbi:uncharacterized protein LOC131972802 isoform X1 [Centropristis striata]|uniref:uncharacterized protein LOC131972802 isoform X1 n=1 Tax=Centropristis striata TaxID=184440 RepID=UPI0027E0696B|nr:uncharacterized protein LOC131972802 isoform X1 [Centropristis striata]